MAQTDVDTKQITREALAPAQASGHKESHVHKEPHILVIDDEDSIAGMVADALRDEGYTVTVAYDGRQGLELAQKQPPDLIITDVMMPYMDGIKMAELLHRQLATATPPIVFMSAVDCRQQVQMYGGFLAKPFTLDMLFDVVDSML